MVIEGFDRQIIWSAAHITVPLHQQLQKNEERRVKNIIMFNAQCSMLNV